VLRGRNGKKGVYTVILTDVEKAMLDGARGPARQKAMELLVRYGEALGAERFVETNNVATAISSVRMFLGSPVFQTSSVDAVFSHLFLDSDEAVEIPQTEVPTCHLIAAMDPSHWEIMGYNRRDYELNMEVERVYSRVGIQLMNTCAPYLLGNVPVKSEHCAWMESSAVIYCNSVLGGRTNTEGSESTAAAMLTGRIPYWGFHLDENRPGTHLVRVEYDVESEMDWGLLGYYAGEVVEEKSPVFDGIRRAPNIARLKHCGAAAASSGGVEIYHVIGHTPEASSLEEAFGGKKPVDTLKFGKAERKMAYDNLTSARNTDVDFVMLGCPHYTVEQIWNACKLLEGKRVHSNTSLWIFTPRALRDIADRQGLTDIITRAGGYLLADTCPAISHKFPRGARVAATDSAKQAHYMPPILDLPTWFGSQEDCIQAAITGKWRGELK
jgi:predicted aconitase